MAAFSSGAANPNFQVGDGDRQGKIAESRNFQVGDEAQKDFQSDGDRQVAASSIGSANPNPIRGKFGVSWGDQVGDDSQKIFQSDGERQMAASSTGTANPNSIRGKFGVCWGDQVGVETQNSFHSDGDGWQQVSYRKNKFPRGTDPAMGGRQRKYRNQNVHSHGDNGGFRRNVGVERFPIPKSRPQRTQEGFRGDVGQRSQESVIETNSVPLFNKQPTSWSNIVTNSIQNKEETKLEFFQPNPDDSITIPNEEIKSNADNWSHTILLYVVGRRPYFVHLKAYIKRMWSPSKEVKLFSRENGFFLVKFDSAEECDRILDRGPWMFDGRIIIMRKWSADLCLEKDLLTHIPVWIKLPHLEMRFWSKNCISRIASSLGKPIRMDYATANCSRISFARVLVDISVQQPLKKSIKIVCENGSQVVQPVEYEWLPPCCSRCKYFGHTSDQCPLEEMVWKEKGREENVDNNSSKALNVEVGSSELGDGSTIIDKDKLSSSCFTGKNNDKVPTTGADGDENESEEENLGEHQSPEDAIDEMEDDDNEDPILQSIQAKDRRLLSQIMPNWSLDIIKLRDQAKEKENKMKKAQLIREEQGKTNKRELRSTKK